MRYLSACIVMTLTVAFFGCTGGGSGDPAAEVARKPSDRQVERMLAAAARPPTATPERLTPTPEPDPEIYDETGEVFLETWMGVPVKRPPSGVGSRVGEKPRLEDAARIWREFFRGTTVLARGVTYDLCRDGTSIYVSGAPGMWPAGTTLSYLLLPYEGNPTFDYTHIELQISPDQPELIFPKLKYQAYHIANVDGYTVGYDRGGILIDAPVIANTRC